MGGARTWKSFGWSAMNRLHEKGLISDPVSKARSVVLTETGLREAEAAFRRLVERGDWATRGAGVIAASADAPTRRRRGEPHMRVFSQVETNSRLMVSEESRSTNG